MITLGKESGEAECAGCQQPGRPIGVGRIDVDVPSPDRFSHETRCGGDVVEPAVDERGAAIGVDVVEDLTQPCDRGDDAVEPSVECGVGAVVPAFEDPDDSRPLVDAVGGAFDGVDEFDHALHDRSSTDRR
ncbi:MAG: hypothetical protein R2743_02715 [Ilumatobacteraceae bacterium]